MRISTLTLTLLFLKITHSFNLINPQQHYNQQLQQAKTPNLISNPMSRPNTSRTQMQANLAHSLANQKPQPTPPPLPAFKAELKNLIERYAEVLRASNKSSNPQRFNKDSQGNPACHVMENPCNCPLDNFCCVNQSYDKLFVKLDNVYRWLMGLDGHQKQNVLQLATESYLLSCPDWLADFFKLELQKKW